MITFRFNKLEAEKVRKAMFTSADKVVKATAAAISDTTKSLKVVASSEIRKELNIKKKAVDKRIQRFFINKLSGGIRIRARRPISLSNLTREGKAKQTKKGVEYKLYQSRPKIFIPSAFGPKIIKLSRSVYVRAGKARKPLNIKQYTDLAQDMHSQGVVSRLNREANELMRYHLKRRFNLLKLREQGKVK
jgi:hypothetical protein